MSSFRLARDKQGFHIHISPKHFYTIIGVVLSMIAIILGFAGYTFYKANYYDSSLSVVELRDFNPPSPPPGIAKKIQQIQSPQKKVEGIYDNIHVASISASLRVPILMFHYIEYVKNKDDKTRMSLDTNPYAFEQEIRTLKEAGYTFMTNSELAEAIDRKKELPPRPILLTFDDGYRDFYADAYPILKKYNAKATQYVIAGFINRPNHLLLSQLQQIASDGLVEIGAHTVNHVWLKGAPLRTVSNEIFQSREILQQMIHKPVVSFAYPFGAFDEQAIKVVKDAGFSSAVATIPGIDQGQINKYFLFRLRPGGRTGQSLINYLNQQKFNNY